MIASVAGCVLAAPASAESLPAGFQQTVAFGGLDAPTAVEFAPDGRAFVAEKAGLVKSFDGPADETATVVADLRTQVHDYWDRGLLDIALDPDFTHHPYLYALYTYDAPPGGTAPTYEAPGGGSDVCPGDESTGNCVVTGRLTRMLIDGTPNPEEEVLVTDWCQQFLSHSIGSIAFDAEGALYASGGDGPAYLDGDWGEHGTPSNPCGDPPGGVGAVLAPPTAEGGVLRSQDLRTSGDPTGLSGSIIRVDRATGDPLPDNPNVLGPDANARRIVAYGLRNPFRITINPETDELWAGDVGWSEWEEINRVLPGAQRNFGWPCYEGADPSTAYGPHDLDICTDLYAEAGAVTAPSFAYHHHDAVVAGDGCQVGSGSMSGLSFYNGGVFPQSYDGSLFFADYVRRCIWAIPAGSNGMPDPGPNHQNVIPFAVGTAPVGLTAGTDGAMYYADIGDFSTPASGRIMAIRYFQGNQPPFAVITADRTSGDPPLTVAFDGTGSFDPDPDTAQGLTYEWDLDGDGQYDDSTDPTPSRTYGEAGIYTVRLRVTDDAADPAVGTARLGIQVGNTPPRPQIVTPTTALRWDANETIGFSGTVDDDQETLGPESLEWNVAIVHCAPADPSNCHDHPLQSIAGADSGSFTAPSHEYPAHLVLSLTATDSDGLSATDRVRLDPRTVEFQMRSNPPGAELTINSTTKEAPFTQTLIAGSQASITTEDAAVIGGKRYRWQGWTHGGSRTQTVTADADRTYTASYESSNHPPTSIAFSDLDYGIPPFSVSFDATNSSDPEPGTVLSYEWDLDGDGAYDDSTEAKPRFTYETPGTRLVGLRVTDDEGLSDLDWVPILVLSPEAHFNGLTPKLELRTWIEGIGDAKVRLLGIDLSSGKGRCGTRGVKRRLTKLLSPGDALVLSSSPGMPEHDRRGALIRSVAVGGADVALSLVRSGWATVDTEQRFASRGDYMSAQRAAKRAGAGAWSCRGGSPGQ